jgi:hypothetical protein
VKRLGASRMSTASKNESQWKARFNLHRNGVIVSRVTDLSPDVTLVTQSDGCNTHVVSIEIVTPGLSLLDAIDRSQLIANRCADVLSFISGFGVTCSLGQINEINGELGITEGGVMSSATADLAKPEEVDLTKPAFQRVMQEKDAKLALQLSHFRRGLSSSDVIDQIKEFYQVIEGEYGKNDPRFDRYRYVRNLVSHPELNDPNVKNTAIALVGKTYLDPSEPQDLSALMTDLKNIKTEARNIIQLKI